MKTTFMLFCSRNYKNCHDPPFVSLAADSQKLFPNFLSEFHGRRHLVIEPTMEVNRFHTAVFVIFASGALYIRNIYNSSLDT